MKTIKDCFDVVLKGNKEESRLAAGKVRKTLYGRRKSKNEYRYIKNMINSAPQEYEKITEDWRQEYFVRAISVIYFLHDMEAEIDFLFPWLFQLLQHDNGIIRYGAVKMIKHELGPLTVHIRFPERGLIFGKDLDPESVDQILYSLFVNLIQLILASHKEKYRRYKYIDSLPASKYKSAQMILVYMEELCGEANIEKMAQEAGVYKN